MAVKNILPSDTLEVGFRAKYNETIREIITSASLLSNGKLRLTKGSGFFDVDFFALFYSKDQIDQILSDVSFAIPLATEAVPGIIKIATMELTNEGEDDQSAITPYKAKNSSVFPFKGTWVQPSEGEGYLTNSVVIRNGGIYQNTVFGNETDPIGGTGWILLSSGIPDGIITAGDVDFDNGTFLATFISPFTYRLNDQILTPIQPTIQLNAPDGASTRIDIIYGKTDGTYGFVEGIPAYTYEAPSIPPNTLALVILFRYADGTTKVIILDASGYYPKTAGDLFGDVKIKNGWNLYLDAAEGTEDSGDIVFRKYIDGVLKETERIFSGLNGDNGIYVRFDGYPNPTNQILHTGSLQRLLKTVIEVDETPLNIDWKNDLVQYDFAGRTYAEKHGNSPDIKAVAITGNTGIPYNPEYSFIYDEDGNIETFSLIVVQTGKLTII